MKGEAHSNFPVPQVRLSWLVVVVIGLVLVLISGCASPYRDASGNEVPKQILAQCEYEGQKAGGGGDLAYGSYAYAKVKILCLEMKGYK